MRGKIQKVSLPRRLVIDLMRASMHVPFVSLARPLSVRPLVEARNSQASAPGWAAIFTKSFSIVAASEPVLRRLYLRWPYPHFYQLPRSVGMVAIARNEFGDDCILPQKI